MDKNNAGNDKFEMPAKTSQVLGEKRIFFAHQSVGNNILEGIIEISTEKNKLNILKTTDIKNFSNPVLAHFEIGQNGNPVSKFAEFRRILNDGIGSQIDTAILKLCFVDIDANSDIVKIFEEYKSCIENLQLKFPKVKFIHFTVPLLTKKKLSVSGVINDFLGKRDFFHNDHNIARNTYNQLLIKEFGGKSPVFDLARIESQKPDGMLATFTYNRKQYYALANDYSSDGGHLNERGRKIIARELVEFLANN